MALKVHKNTSNYQLSAIINYQRMSLIFEHIKSIYLDAWWQFDAFLEMYLFQSISSVTNKPL